MDNGDREAFANAISMMHVTMGVEATTQKLRGYWMTLADLTIEEVERGVYEAMKRNKFLPKPAEIRELGKPEVDLTTTASLAWETVLQKIPCGAWKHMDFEDKVINAVIRCMGGWPTFLEQFTNAEREKWVRLEFEKKYKAFSSQGIGDEQAKPLAGLSEKQNGFDPVPVFVKCEYPLLLPEAKSKPAVPFRPIPETTLLLTKA